jgi:hypothetical protein
MAGGGGGRGIRTPGTLSDTPVFKTGAINQLCHSSWLITARRRIDVCRDGKYRKLVIIPGTIYRILPPVIIRVIPIFRARLRNTAAVWKIHRRCQKRWFILRSPPK